MQEESAFGLPAGENVAQQRERENWAAFMQEGSLGLFSAHLKRRLFS
jgi:hypothetical protein